MQSFRVKSAPPIQAEITVPGDKSISHRAVLFSALTNGPCEIKNFLPGEDCVASMRAMEQLGITAERPEANRVIIHGNRGAFVSSDSPIDCGNSGTTMRLLSGLLAPRGIHCRLTGDESLSARPMKRVIDPLSRMGAKITAEGKGDRPPLRIEEASLQGIDYELPVASAQVKSAILLAGLLAKGRTTVTEPSLSRDHTERMLQYYLVTLRKEGNKTIIHGGQQLESRDFSVPGDISSAAFWLVAAAAKPGSRLILGNVGLNPSRTGILSVLIRMGARIREVVESPLAAEPVGTIDIEGGILRGTEIYGAEIPNVIDELPILAVAGALAEGKTIIRDARELRVKETDRLAALATNLRAMGVPVQEFDDGMEIQGSTKLQGATVESYGDHRIAMAFAIAALFAKRETTIKNTACVATSYPGFYEVLEKIISGERSGKFAVPRKLKSQ